MKNAGPDADGRPNEGGSQHQCSLSVQIMATDDGGACNNAGLHPHGAVKHGLHPDIEAVEVGFGYYPARPSRPAHKPGHLSPIAVLANSGDGVFNACQHERIPMHGAISFRNANSQALFGQPLPDRMCRACQEDRLVTCGHAMTRMKRFAIEAIFNPKTVA